MKFSEQKFRFIGILGSLIVSGLGRTLRIKTSGCYPEENVIFIFWHGKFFPLIYKFMGKGVTVLVSQHRDGEFLTRILKRLGYNLVRGSSQDGVIKAIRLLVNTHSKIAIAPDGPKGERCKVKKGLLRFARLIGCNIVPVGIGISKGYEFNSWDRFNLPLPFSRCVIMIGKPVKPNEVDEQSLEKILNECNRKAEGICGR